MAKLYVDTNKYDDGEGAPVVEAFNSTLKDLVRRKFDESGVPWSQFVFGKSYGMISATELAEIDRKVLASGHRYQVSAVISMTERPEAYKSVDGVTSGSTACFEHPEAVVGPADEQGREPRGQGDNVVEYESNIIGKAKYFRSVQDVMSSLAGGVPPGTIAIIDDSGGTLTAPILEHFKAVVCAGGTVRSHLGILTREYGIPCLMNAKISGVMDGDTIELEVTAPAKTTEAYQKGVEMVGRIWRLKAADGS